MLGIDHSVLSKHICKNKGEELEVEENELGVTESSKNALEVYDTTFNI